MNATLTMKATRHLPHLGGFVLFLCLFVAAGCNLVPQTQYVADEPLEFADGTSVEAGGKVYLDANENATANDIDPVTKQPNKPFLVTDVAKLEKLKEAGEKTAGGLPPPFGWIAALGIGVFGAGGIAAARKLNAKKLADAGAKPKKS